jgi:uncharacterized phage-associated protein
MKGLFQKLMYYVCRDYLHKTGQELISESFGVWQYGPVLVTIYDEFKSFRSRPINSYAKDADCKSFMLDENSDSILAQTLDDIWEKYKFISAIDLSKMTHRDGSGWSSAFQRGDSKITKEDMINDRT